MQVTCCPGAERRPSVVSGCETPKTATYAYLRRAQWLYDPRLVASAQEATKSLTDL